MPVGSTLAEAFVEIGVATGKLKEGFAAAKPLVGNLAGGLVSALGPVAAAFAGAFAVHKMVENAKEGEAATSALTAALRTSGQEVAGNMARFDAFAGEIEKVTRHGDEATFALLTMGTNMGVPAESLETMAKNAIGLGTALGIDAADAMKMLAKETQGVQSKLDKQIPSLKGVTDQTQRLAIISEMAGKGFEQEKAKTQTMEGAFAQMSNSVGNLAEQMGYFLVPMITWAAQAIRDLADWMKEGIASFQEAGVEMPNTMEYLSAAFSNLKSVALTVFNALSSVVGTVFDFCIGLFEEYMGWVVDLWTHIEQFGMHTGEAFDGINSAVTGFGSVVSTVFSYVGSFIHSSIAFIGDVIKELVFTFLNLDLVIKGWGITIAETFTTVVDRSQWLWTNIKIGAVWFVQNFPEIFQTGLDYALTALINWGENIRSVFTSVAEFIGSAFSAIWEAIKNGTVSGLGDALKKAVDEFQPELKSTFEGAHNYVDKGPAFQAFTPSLDFSQQKADLKDQWEKRRAEWEGISKENPLEAAMPDTMEAGQLKATKKGKGGSSEGKDAGGFQALGTAFEKANSAIAKAQEKKDKEMLDLGKKQLIEQEKTNKQLEKLAVGGLA